MSAAQLQIGEVARRAKLTIRAVRYYEEKGLLSPSSYTSSGLRLYSNQDVNRLVFIRRLKQLGMSLEEIRMCLGLPGAFSTRKSRVEHTIELLRMQKGRTQEEIVRLEELQRDIESSLEKVTKCAICTVEKCSEECPSFGYVL